MKKPSEEFESLMQLVRIVSTPLVANVVDPNYNVNPRIITTLVFIALFIILSFLTFLRMYNGDWTITMEVFSTIGTCINGIAKSASVLKYSDLYADTYLMLLDVYVTYKKLGENYCQIMRKLCERCRKIIKFVGFAYIAYTVTVIVTPFCLLAYNGKRQIILHFLLPQMDLSTDFGYFFNLTFQACCVIIAGFGLYACDLLVFIYLTHAILYSYITKLKVQALNVKIESGLQSNLNID